jgi:hypothetical protein
MRRVLAIVCLVITLAVASTARADQSSSALLVTGPQEAPPAGTETLPPLDEGAGYSLQTQEFVTGAAIVGGAMLLGILASGSLATGLTTASAVYIIYSFMP